MPCEGQLYRSLVRAYLVGLHMTLLCACGELTPKFTPPTSDLITGACMGNETRNIRLPASFQLACKPA